MLVYRYEQYFLENAGKNKLFLEEIEKIYKLIASGDETPEITLEEVMTPQYYAQVDQEISYIIQHFFDKISAKDIDFAYLDQLAPVFYVYRDLVRDMVNTHTVSF